MTETDEKSLFAKLKSWWLPAAALLVFVGLMLAPDEACERFTTCHWEFKGARILPSRDRGMLLLHLHSMGAARGRSFNQLVTVDLASGKQLGRHVTSNWVKPFGLTGEHLWVRQGGARAKDWTAYALPDLTEAYDLESLLEAHPQVGWPVEQARLDPAGGDRIVLLDKAHGWFALDPESNSLTERSKPEPDPWWNGALLPQHCEHPPEPPRAVDGELLLDGAFVCDNTTGRLIALSGDRLVAYQDLERETGKLILGRLNSQGAWAWRFKEQERFGARPREAHGYRVAFAAPLAGLLVLVLEQDDGAGDVWVVGLDPVDGRQKWAWHAE